MQSEIVDSEATDGFQDGVGIERGLSDPNQAVTLRMKHVDVFEGGKCCRHEDAEGDIDGITSPSRPSDIDAPVRT